MPAPSERRIRSGVGWRLGWKLDAEYCGLVGGENWAIELTQAEFDDFCRLALQLSETIQHLATELMDEEKIACELESDRLWLEAEGYADAYSLRFILLTGRQAEAGWQPEAVPELLQAIQLLGVF